MAIDNHNVGSRRPFTTQVLFKNGIGVQTLTGAVTLTDQSSQFLLLDPGGATRVVTLPAAENGLFFYIVNTADAAEDLTVSDGSTVATLNQNDAAWFVSDGTDWYCMGVHVVSGQGS